MPLGLGPITAILIATRFTPELQGYYYTFGSLTSLVFLAEVGLSQALMQFASHEWNHLSMNVHGRVMGEAKALSRLRSLARIALRWYGGTAVALVSILSAVGYTLFIQQSLPSVDWFWQWLALCFGVGLNYCLLPIWALLQGCNQSVQFWMYRLIQQLVNGVSLWIAIVLGAGLWTSAVAVACGLVWSGTFLLNRYPEFCASLVAPPTGSTVHWRNDVWPIQWRGAITWLTTYFTIPLFTPILFRLAGPAVAGQMGLTSTLVWILMGLAASWLVPMAPRFGMLAEQRNYLELDRLFFRSFRSSIGVAAAGAGVCAAGAYWLSRTEYPLRLRILPLAPTMLFMAAAVLTAIPAGLAVYLRAHKKEELAAVQFICSVLSLGVAIVLGRHSGALGVAAGHCGVLVCFQVPVSILIFRRCRARWRQSMS